MRSASRRRRLAHRSIRRPAGPCRAASVSRVYHSILSLSVDRWVTRPCSRCCPSDACSSCRELWLVAAPSPCERCEFRDRRTREVFSNWSRRPSTVHWDECQSLVLLAHPRPKPRERRLANERCPRSRVHVDGRRGDGANGAVPRENRIWSRRSRHESSDWHSSRLCRWKRTTTVMNE